MRPSVPRSSTATPGTCHAASTESTTRGSACEGRRHARILVAGPAALSAPLAPTRSRLPTSLPGCLGLERAAFSWIRDAATRGDTRNRPGTRTGCPGRDQDARRRATVSAVVSSTAWRIAAQGRSLPGALRGVCRGHTSSP